MEQTNDEYDIVNHPINNINTNNTLLSSLKKWRNISSGQRILNLIEDTNIFVITVNDIPTCYLNNLEQANYHMWILARRLSSSNHSSTTYIFEKQQHEIHIIEKSKIFLISYDNLKYIIRLYEVSELVNLDNLNKCQKILF